MTGGLQRVTRFFARLFAAGAGLSMLGLFLIIVVNSTRRYSLGRSLEWGEELPVYIAIYGVMFGMAWAYLQDRHVRFTILVAFTPASWVRRLNLVVDAAMVTIGAMLAWSGYLFAAKRGGIEAPGLINGARSLGDLFGWDGLVVLGRMYPYQLAIALGGVMIAIAALLRLLNRVAEPVGEKPAVDFG